MTERTHTMNTEYPGGRGAEYVLRIRLDTDTYEVVYQSGAAQDAGYGMCERASEWFRNYALRGYVLEEDLAAYLLFTERHAMRKWAADTREQNILTFRRRIGQTVSPVTLKILPDRESTRTQPIALAVFACK